MALVMTPIYTQTVSGTTTNVVNFNNIPQFYTDLKVVASVRTDGNVVNFNDGAIRFNGDTSTVYSFTGLNGSGSTATSQRGSGMNYLAIGPNQGSLTTANTFTSWDAYIPNYTSSNFKSVINDGTPENNSTATNLELYAGLWRSTAAITSITIFPGGGYNFVVGSTLSLYGIIRSGA